MAISLQLTDHGVPLDQCTWPRVSASDDNLTCVLHRDTKSSSIESMQSSNSRDTRQNKVSAIVSSVFSVIFSKFSIFREMKNV